LNSLYLHIPYCKTRCGYCDFHSSICDDDQESYVEALCQEMELRKDYLPDTSLGTIYFGGGTPSLLSIAQFKRIFKSINQYFHVEKEAEITLEANPDDLSEAFLKNLIDLGFNRISIGIQSFDDDDLKLINRRHTGQEAINVVKAAQQAGFKNISADLIFGLPHQTLQKWEHNLQQLFDLNIQHISCYNLSYEEGTTFHQKLMAGELQEMDDEESLAMYQMLIEQSKANGFVHYETSNFAKEGLYSKHNSHYWTGEPYLGLGAGAHSFNGTSRSWNISDNSEYIACIQNGTPPSEEEKINLRISYNEFIMTGLRTMWGCQLPLLEERFGKKMFDFCMNAAKEYLKDGNLEIKDDTLTISPKSIFISDKIMADLMMVE
jgi:oxygen-independent coproporphyrinogen-3 oxidase